ncbi:MAG: LysR family transcriptional regulator [Cyanobacteria bacterium P01_A01_bin.17]
MRLEQLKAFLAIAETGSFQKAAQKCETTQPTISRQLQALEIQIGAPLFHRGSSVRLTRAGEYLLNHARKICQSWSQAIEELADLLGGRQTELCVAVIGSVCAYYLPIVLEKFGQDYPEVQLRVTSLGSDRALKVLQDGLVDLAIVMNNPLLTASAELVIDPLYDEPIEVLMAVNHPLADHAQVSWTELSHYPQVVFKDGYGMQRLVHDQFQCRGLSLNAILEVNALDAFRGVVRQGKAVALLPRSALLDVHYDPSLTVRSTTKAPVMRQVVMVTTRDRLQIPPIERFYQLTQKFLPAQLTEQVAVA